MSNVIPKVATATGVGMAYRKSAVLHGIDLSIEAGTELAITGRSGSGKTTLLLILAGLLPPDTGEVRWPGLDPDAELRRRQIGLVFQAPSLMPELTAAENVALPLRLHGQSLATAADAADSALVALGLADAADAMPAQLSGGMQQRVAIARALAGKPLLILADEPTGALDRDSAFNALSALRDSTSAYGGALVVATHDRELADLLGRQSELEDGKLRVGAAS
ncbi:MAG: ATP-binding cassette domain-containing protein [Mycobacteriales bacterium]